MDSSQTTVENTRSRFQHTLGAPITVIGIGLHSGERSVLTLKPAPENAGVRFLRRDLGPERSEVIPRWHNVTDTSLCTRISNAGGASVSTIEHLLAALRCCGVDNLDVELDSEEVPIMDGSAAPFVELIKRVGTVPQQARRWCIEIAHPLAHANGDKFALFLPATTSRITVEIDFPDHCIGRQIRTVELNEGLAEQIAGARTFGFAEQIEELKRRGLGLGGNLNNAIVVDRQRVLNPEGLRYPDEFVRHKLLDALGDLSLAGARIIGHLYAYKPGHTLMQALLQKLFAYPAAWRYRPMADTDSPEAAPDRTSDSAAIKKPRHSGRGSMHSQLQSPFRDR